MPRFAQLYLCSAVFILHLCKRVRHLGYRMTFCLWEHKPTISSENICILQVIDWAECKPLSFLTLASLYITVYLSKRMGPEGEQKGVEISTLMVSLHPQWQTFRLILYHITVESRTRKQEPQKKMNGHRLLCSSDFSTTVYGARRIWTKQQSICFLSSCYSRNQCESDLWETGKFCTTVSIHAACTSTSCLTHFEHGMCT